MNASLIKTIVMLTDPGNEIDDEILMHLLMTQETINTNVWIVCVPGVTSTNPLPNFQEIQAQVNSRIQRIRDVFPETFGKNQNFWTAPCERITRQRSPSIFTLATMEQVEEAMASTGKPLEVDYLLHVAPLWHIEPERLRNVFQVKTRIFMGDLTNPDKSMNGTKAMPKDCSYLRSQFENQEKVFEEICEKSLDIPTQFARNIPTPFSFMKILPETMRSPLLTTAFNQFVGRPSAHFPWAEDISKANHKTIMAMISEDTPLCTLTTNEKKQIQSQIEFFLNNEKIDKNNIIIHDPMSYKSRLEDIARVVKHVTKSSYVSLPEFTSFNKDNLESNRAKENWESYITTHNCHLTPFYDGLAWIVMREGKLPTQERCMEMISSVS